jgi:hypothetical protein
MRAYPFSQAVNSGMVDAFIDGSWNFKAFKDELHNFPLSTYKDQVDAGSDAYSHLYRLFHRGLVVKNFLSLTNLVSWSRFARRFAVKIPGHWEVSGGLRIEGDKSKPSAWAITARAAENAMMGEVVFLVASRKFHNNDVNFILKDFAGALERYCEKGAAQTGICWLRKGNTEVQQLAQEKFNLTLHEFEGDEMEGIPETNWYFQFEPQMVHPFYQRVGASHFYLLTADDQIDIPVDDEGLLASRQDLATWAYNDDGKPQPFGGVTLDCVRMTLFNFALSATAMTDQERRVGKLPDELKPATVLGRLGKPDFVEQYTAQQYALNQIKIEEQRERDKQRKEMGKILQMPRRRQFGKRRAS